MSLTGTGIHRSTGAAALAVKNALHDVAVAAIDALEVARLTAELEAAGEAVDVDQLEREVDVSYGYRWPAHWPDAVAVTAVQVVAEEGTVGPRQRREMTVRQDFNITSWRVTDDEKVTHRRAFDLLAVIDARVREIDPTLAGAALWCRLGDVQSDGATTEDDAGEGRFTEIAATFEARVLISS